MRKVLILFCKIEIISFESGSNTITVEYNRVMVNLSILEENHHYYYYNILGHLISAMYFSCGNPFKFTFNKCFGIRVVKLDFLYSTLQRKLFLQELTLQLSAKRVSQSRAIQFSSF